jgi:hypothetical protein
MGTRAWPLVGAAHQVLAESLDDMNLLPMEEDTGRHEVGSDSGMLLCQRYTEPSSRVYAVYTKSLIKIKIIQLDICPKKVSIYFPVA